MCIYITHIFHIRPEPPPLMLIRTRLQDDEKSFYLLAASLMLQRAEIQIIYAALTLSMTARLWCSYKYRLLWEGLKAISD